MGLMIFVWADPAVEANIAYGGVVADRIFRDPNRQVAPTPLCPENLSFDDEDGDASA